MVDQLPPAVERDAGAAVVPLDHAPGIPGVDPEIVVVAVRRGDLGEGAPAVGRLPHLEIGHVDRVGVDRVREDVAVVPGAMDQVAVVGDELPRSPAVVRAVEARARRLDDGPDAIAPGRGHADPDLALDPARQPRIVGDVRPGVAPVGRLVDPAVRAPAGERPEVAVHLPGGRVEDAGVARVEGEVDRARLVAREEDLLPAAAAVPGAEDPALPVGSERVAERGDVHQVGVAGVDADLADVTAVGQPHVRPRLAAVGRLVDAVAVGDVDPDGRLPRSRVDDAGIRLGHRQRTDGRRSEVAVGDVLPVRAAVRRLPHPTGHGTEVEHRRLGWMAGDRDHPPAARGTDAAPPEGLEQGWVHRIDLASSEFSPPFGSRSELEAVRDDRPARASGATGHDAADSRLTVRGRPSSVSSTADRSTDRRRTPWRKCFP